MVASSRRRAIGIFLEPGFTSEDTQIFPHNISIYSLHNQTFISLG